MKQDNQAIKIFQEAQQVPAAVDNKIPVGISQCVLGDNVRYDGGHKRSRYCSDQLSKIFDFVPICPEVGIGMSVPRPTIRLVKNDEQIKAVVAQTDEDVTERLDKYAKQMHAEHQQLRGYIFCARSPSCGAFRVKVYETSGHTSTTAGRGIFAKTFQSLNPLLPIEEDGRLNDVALRENFIARVFTYHNWLNMQSEPLTLSALIDFHARHKFLTLAHSQKRYRELGQIVANGKKVGMQETGNTYIHLLMDALSFPATRKNHVNVLMHIQGFFKYKLSKIEKRELRDCIDKYRLGFLPLLAPVSILQHYLRIYPNNYLEKQAYFNPYPEFLKLRYTM